MAFDQTKYIDDYKKQNYDRMTFFVPKGKGKVIKDYAKSLGLSPSQVIIRALENQYSLDMAKADGE